MAAVPLGAELNLGLQLTGLALLLVGFYFAFHARRRSGPAEENPGRAIARHRGIMTAAVVVAGIGLLTWMLPNLLYGWYYGGSALGYGSGGWSSYFVYDGSWLPHWYLLAAHIVLGALVAGLSTYLVLRMRWSGFPRRLAVVRFRELMQLTWGAWIANVALGILVFYYYAYLGVG